MRRRPSPRSPGTDGGIPARPTESVAPSDSVSSGRSPRCSESRLQPHRMQRETSAGCHSRAEPCTTTPPKQAPAEPPCRRPGNGNSSLPVPEGRRRRNRFPDPAAARPSFHLHAAVSPENVRSRPRPERETKCADTGQKRTVHVREFSRTGSCSTLQIGITAPVLSKNIPSRQEEARIPRHTSTAPHSTSHVPGHRSN